MSVIQDTSNRTKHAAHVSTDDYCISDYSAWHWANLKVTTRPLVTGLAGQNNAGWEWGITYCGIYASQLYPYEDSTSYQATFASRLMFYFSELTGVYFRIIYTQLVVHPAITMSILVV